jgi:pseudaminic acid biosynthesis-associated methylase
VNHKTSQENFWSSAFGDEYIERNNHARLLASNLHFFSNVLKKTDFLNSCIEFGANIGMNLKALQLLFPEITCTGIEINEKASQILSQIIGSNNVFNGSIFETPPLPEADLSFTKGVLIHINPERLQDVYEKLYVQSSKYILIAEYYNPTPVSIKYRGYDDKLFKRDFAGEFMDKYPSVRLIDYGFSYKKDTVFPQDDITWFLFKK